MRTRACDRLCLVDLRSGFASLILALGLSFFAPSPVLAQSDLQTVQEAHGLYRTSGVVRVARPLESVEAVLARREAYSRWLLRGIDGSDPVSADFIGVLRHIDYHPDRRRFVLTYDVNLPWPLGSRGNTIEFAHADDRVREAARGTWLRRHRIFLAQPEGAVEVASLDYRLEAETGRDGGEDHTRIEFVARIGVSWLVGLFLNLDTYRDNMEWRIERVLGNLLTEVAASEL